MSLQGTSPVGNGLFQATETLRCVRMWPLVRLAQAGQVCEIGTLDEIDIACTVQYQQVSSQQLTAGLSVEYSACGLSVSCVYSLYWGRSPLGRPLDGE